MLKNLLLMLLLALGAVPAAAHLTPNSEVRLDFGRSMVAAEVVIPLGELRYATGRRLALPEGPVAGAERERLSSYLLGHMRAHAADGRPWQITIDRLDVVADTPRPDLVGRVLMTPPAGTSVRSFELGYDAVIDRVPNHFVMVVAKTDFDRGRLSDRPEIIGGLQGTNRSLRIDRGAPMPWRGFLASIGLGMHHIAEGHDHLLFLFVLLLPAPLLVRAGRWAEYGGVRYTVRRLALVVTAFTIGHSLTLIGGAFFGWSLPAQPVEVLIALSILVSAIHACRPLFAGREPLVAGGFGLVHGLAFATLIGHFGLEPVQKAQSILGFNLGIELVQLAVVAATLPALVIFARYPGYAVARIAGAALAMVASAAWAVERVLEVDNPIGRGIDQALAYAPAAIGGATAAALLTLMLDRRRGHIPKRDTQRAPEMA